MSPLSSWPWHQYVVAAIVLTFIGALMKPIAEWVGECVRDGVRHLIIWWTLLSRHRGGAL